MQILIAEDEAIIAESLYQVLQQLGHTVIEPASNSGEAIQFIEADNPAFAIVDIHLGEPYAGFKVADTLKRKNIPFIFLTALYDKPTVERAGEFSPAGYLVKPFTKENLFATIELATSQQNYRQQLPQNLPAQVFIKNAGKHIVFNPSDIIYIQTEGKYVKLFTTDSKTGILIRSSLKELLEELNLPVIKQVHKSYAVNISHIKAIKYDELFIAGIAVPLGRQYRDELKKELSFIN
jgi:two-component system, LytTR family, response regulator LytT